MNINQVKHGMTVRFHDANGIGMYDVVVVSIDVDKNRFEGIITDIVQPVNCTYQVGNVFNDFIPDWFVETKSTNHNDIPPLRNTTHIEFTDEQKMASVKSDSNLRYVDFDKLVK
jgi:hypothetical protein